MPALVEKLTNSIDAILMKRCMQEGIDPKSKEAPRSVEDAVKRFFPKADNWDLSKYRTQQAEQLQIIAHGPIRNTSLVIYDDGEGQSPDAFEDTFLSLLRGNKTEIQFVQGKYNMGGAGAIAFCGKLKYQLVASKKYDSSGKFGFTLVRRHPLTEKEKETRRSTWYEYLTVNGQIPRFDITSLDLGLHNREFSTGTILKLYSYQLPPNSIPINRDLNRSINELLFEPALPVLIVEQKTRYPRDRGLYRAFYGLKRRLEETNSQYVERSFQETYSDKDIGKFTATVYVFNVRVDGRSVKDSRDAIRNEFFKNNMAVTFSLNGQVHAPFTTEFITRTLKFPLIKDYLLIHVDCTELKMDFRNELFMASRDRAKSGDEMSKLRHILGDVLRRGELKDIYKARKDSIGGHTENTDSLLRDFSKNLPLKNELLSLLQQDFKIEKPGKRRRNTEKEKSRKHDSEDSFKPERFPSSLSVETKNQQDGLPMVKIPLNGEKTIRFSTDVEDAFFERVEEPGDFKLGILGPGSNEGGGGNRLGMRTKVEDVFSVRYSSPSKGTIRVSLKSEGDLEVDERIKIKATLSSKVGDLDEIFLVQISEPDQDSQPSKKPKKDPEPVGLPEAIRVFEKENGDNATWNSLEGGGVDMDYGVVVFPHVEDDKLEKVYINMDSSVIKNYRSKQTNLEQITLADNRYFSTVYFHTLFLYTISKKMNYRIRKDAEGGESKEVDLNEYISDLFSHHYSEFLVNFEMDVLLDSISE